MVASAMAREGRPAEPIPSARLLPGIRLHFCVPAYLLTCLATCFLVAPPVADWHGAVARMLWTGAWFLPGFLLTTGVTAGVGALLDRSRDRSPDPAAVAREQLAEAHRLLDGLHHARLARALAAIDAGRWNWDEPRCQRVAADLDAAARTFFAAASSAAPERRPAILDLAADGVERLAAALADLGEETRRLDEGDARTVAGYLEARYGGSR